MIFPAIIVPLASQRSLRIWRRATPRLKEPVNATKRLAELTRIGVGAFWPFMLLAVLLVDIDWRWTADDEVGFFAGLAIAAVIAVLGLLVQATIKIIGLLADRRYPSRPLDGVLDELVRLVNVATELRTAWYRPDVSRFLVSQIEAVARACEREPWPRRRASFMDGKLRNAIQDDFLRLAAVIREHKSLIVTSHSQDDHDSVIRSLNDGISAILSDDWQTLLENAPDHVIFRRLITGWGLRNLLPAALLVTGAIILPMLSPFHGAGKSTQELRLSLIAFGIVRLIPGQASIIDILSGALNRASPKP